MTQKANAKIARPRNPAILAQYVDELLAGQTTADLALKFKSTPDGVSRYLWRYPYNVDRCFKQRSPGLYNRVCKHLNDGETIEDISMKATINPLLIKAVDKIMKLNRKYA